MLPADHDNTTGGANMRILIVAVSEQAIASEKWESLAATSHAARWQRTPSRINSGEIKEKRKNCS